LINKLHFWGVFEQVWKTRGRGVLLDIRSLIKIRYLKVTTR
jgi:hypothetical protein